MTTKRIDELNAATDLTGDDLLVVMDGAATTKKITATNARGFMAAASDPVGTAAAAVVAHAGAADPHGDRAYTDGQIAAFLSTAFDFKASVRAATTASITLSGAQTIDGVAVIAGDRVLVKNQATGAENGLYLAASGAWSRTTDADANAEVTAGLSVPVEEGTVNGGRVFLLATANPITVGTTALTFSLVDAGDLRASNNLSDLTSASSARSNLGLGAGAVAGAASDTVAGIVELATSAETTAGTDATRAVTPAGLAAAAVAGAWAAGGALRVEEEGTSIVAAATGMNFVGPSITVTDGGSNEATVTSTAAPRFGTYPYADVGANTKQPLIPGFVTVSSNSTLGCAANLQWFFKLVLDRARTLDEVWINVTTNVAASTAKLALYDADSDAQPTSRIIDLTSAGALDTATTGVKKVTGINTLIPAGFYLWGLATSHAISLRSYDGGWPFPGSDVGDVTLGNQGAGIWGRNGITYANFPESTSTGWAFTSAKTVAPMAIFPVWSS